MLAQNFKSAADLEISENQKSALIKTLVLLETGLLTHISQDRVKMAITKPDAEMNKYFNMIASYGVADCGSVGCIRGTAERVGNVSIPVFGIPTGLYNLFYHGIAITSDPDTSRAAMALRSYLTTGDARWDLALA